MDYDTIESLLSAAKGCLQPEPEKTVFSIGGRGYFENPLTDLLAFFLDPQDVHGFGTLFLESLFDCLEGVAQPGSLDLSMPPQREYSTDRGQRLDLLLQGNDWVLVIENKVNHHQANPFPQYEAFINRQFPGLKPIFVILSPGGRSASDNWLPLSYRAFTDRLKRKVGAVSVDAHYSKWFVILREFILNIEQHAVRYTMDAEAIRFVESNYQDIQNVLRLRESYIAHVQKAGLNTLQEWFPDQRFSTTIHNWKHGPAIRYYAEGWRGQSNLVIQLSHRTPDAGLGIYMYAYGVEETDVERVDQALLQDWHHSPWIESRTIRCYRSGKRYTHYDDLLPEFEATARRFEAFHRAVSGE